MSHREDCKDLDCVDICTNVNFQHRKTCGIVLNLIQRINQFHIMADNLNIYLCASKLAFLASLERAYYSELETYQRGAERLVKCT